MAANLYLQAWRIKKGLTQRGLARESGLTQAQISRIESLSQAPNLKTIEKFAKAIGIEIGDLLSPPPISKSTLSRHNVQKIADAVISGSRDLGPDLNRLADAIASLVGQKLNAHLAPGRRANRGKRLGGNFRSIWVQRIFPEELLNEVLARVDKKLV